MIEDVDGVMVPAVSPVAARDCFVVDTGELQPLVRAFVAAWGRQRPSDGGMVTTGRARRRTATFVSAYTWLEQESRVPQSRLRDIYRGPARRRWTPLAEADAIVTALGRPELLAAHGAGTALVASGAIRVVPDPRGCNGC